MTEMRLLTLLLSLLLAPAALAQGSYEERWIGLADQHATLVAEGAGSDYEAAFQAAHESVAPATEARCARTGQRSGMASFQAVVLLGNDGRVQELLPMPRSPHFRCFEREMTRQRYPAPPSAPFPVVVRFNLSPG